MPFNFSTIIYDDLRIAVIGLGYVGLPVAVGFAEKFSSVIGFDCNAVRTEQLRAYCDSTGEISTERLAAVQMKVTEDPQQLSNVNFFVVAVPTPIDDNKEPDLSPLEVACQTISPHLKRGDIVVFESTVYPGVTEDICGPWLEVDTDLRVGDDFILGYSPERINPGDKAHRLETITKIVACNDMAGLEIIAKAYGAIVTAGV
ncbi:MAG: NAD(P)-binding domain-containing protein, partial [Pseudomonadota bacterium]